MTVPEMSEGLANEMADDEPPDPETSVPDSPALTGYARGRPNAERHVDDGDWEIKV
jgi:hypothetical protein